MSAYLGGGGVAIMCSGCLSTLVALTQEQPRFNILAERAYKNFVRFQWSDIEIQQVQPLPHSYAHTHTHTLAPTR